MSKTTEMVKPNAGPDDIDIDIDDHDVAPKSNHTPRKETPKKQDNTVPERESVIPVGIQPRRGETWIDVDEANIKPDYQKLKKYLVATHPHKENATPYGCWDTCCATSGWHCCGSTTKTSEFDKFGVGVALYFRFVKYMAGFFFMFILLSVPSLYFSIQASVNYADGYDDYKSYLYFTTVGSIGRGSTPCATAEQNDYVNLTCAKGTLGERVSLTYGIVTETRDLQCNLYTFFSWTTTCNNLNTTAIDLAYQHCVGETTCVLPASSEYFDLTKSGCEAESSNTNYYFQAACQNIELTLPGGKTVSRKTVSYILAGCDAGISFLFVLLIITLKFSQKDTIKKIYGSIEAVEERTIEVRNLPKLNREQLKGMLYRHFSNLKDGKRSLGSTKIVDIQFAEPHTIIDYRIQVGNLKKKRMDSVRKFVVLYGGDEYKDKKEVKISDLDKIIENAKKNQKKMKKSLKKIQQLKEKSQKLKEKIKSGLAKKSSIISAYITFDSNRDRDKVLDAFSHNPCSPGCFSICACCFSGDIHVVEKRYLKVEEAPAPLNINWANLDATKKARFIRRLISWIITICLWTITIAFITWIKNRQSIIAQSVKPDKDCTGLSDVSLDDVEEDEALGERAQGLLECYCRAEYERQFKEKICIDWAFNRYLTKALPFVIVFSIIITNMIMQLVFKALASFEKHFTATSELFSRTVKIFIAQFLNTAVIILVVNTRFTQRPIVDFLNGVYNDLIPEWFFNVGTTLIITMFINMLSLPIVNMIFTLIKGCVRCCDRGCTNNQAKTKKKTQKAYEMLYTGGEFLIEIRYAQILNLTFVCFVYGSGLPFLYITSCLNLIIIYWLDKCYILRICKKPRDYDQKLEESIIPFMWVIVLVHIAFSVWVYGNPTIFDKNSGLDASVELLDRVQDSKVPYVIYTVFYRAIRYQNLALSAIFVIIVVIALFKIFFDSTIRKLFNICCKKAANRLRRNNYEASQGYFEMIKRDDLKEENKMIKTELAATSDPTVKDFLIYRQNKVIEQIQKRGNQFGPEPNTFLGLPSYNIFHNPLYKPFMVVEGVQTANELK